MCCIGQVTGASSGVTGYSSYGVAKGGSRGGGGGGAKPKYGSSDRCPRCDKAVYIAEKIVAAGSVRSSYGYIVMEIIIALLIAGLA